MGVLQQSTSLSLLYLFPRKVFSPGKALFRYRQEEVQDGQLVWHWEGCSTAHNPVKTPCCDKPWDRERMPWGCRQREVGVSLFFVANYGSWHVFLNVQVIERGGFVPHVIHWFLNIWCCVEGWKIHYCTVTLFIIPGHQWEEMFS